MEQEERTAYHEAGHAVAAMRQYERFEYVTIIPDEDAGSLGHLLHRPLPKRFHPDIKLTLHMQDKFETRIVITLAGPLAEKRATGRWNAIGAEADGDTVNMLHPYVGGVNPRIAGAHLRYLRCRAEEILKAHWKDVCNVKIALLERKKLSHAEVEQLVWPNLLPAAHLLKALRSKRKQS